MPQLHIVVLMEPDAMESLYIKPRKMIVGIMAVYLLAVYTNWLALLRLVVLLRFHCSYFNYHIIIYILFGADDKLVIASHHTVLSLISNGSYSSQIFQVLSISHHNQLTANKLITFISKT